jgi:hypothetical protein
MTLQDNSPADLTQLGLQKQYSSIGDESYLINSPCVVAQRKILKKGSRYLIFNIPTKTSITLTEILLKDLFFFEGIIYLISEDIKTHQISIVSFPLKCTESICTRYVVDLNYFHERSNEKAIRQYCGDCVNNKKSIGNSKTEAADDLLEFDFK